MIDIINELNASNSTNHKIDVLKKHKENVEFTRILKMAYDKVTFTYGVTIKRIDIPDGACGNMPLELALDVLEYKLNTRELTGNAALDALEDVMHSLSSDDRIILWRIIDRDLKVGIGRTQINKVHKNLIVKPVYMRCSVLNEKTAPKVKFPAILNLKADGTYREITVVDGDVSYNSRTGETYDYPILTAGFSKLVDGKYIGELTVELDQKLLSTIIPKLEKADKKNGSTLVQDITDDFANGRIVLPRSIGNGLIKSGDVPHSNIICDLWDYVTLAEYTNASARVKNITSYHERFDALAEIIGDGTPNIRLIESHDVADLGGAMKLTQQWMIAGLEGSILKNRDAVFRDGTSTEQWKIKLKIDVDVRITGFIEGKIGTSRESTFGSMTFESDDGLVKGSVSSGINDDQLIEFNMMRDELIGQIMEVQCNDITKGRNNAHHALSHPKFIELKTDKLETDSLEKMLDIKAMAMMVTA